MLLCRPLHLLLFLCMLSRATAFFQTRQALTRRTTTRSMATTLTFDGETDTAATPYDTTVFIGKKETLQAIMGQEETLAGLVGAGETADAAAVLRNCTTTMIASLMEAGKAKKTVTSYLPTTTGQPQRLSLGFLPDTVSRNNHVLSVHTMTALAASTCQQGNRTRLFVCGAAETACQPAILAAAVAKAFPLYSRKTKDTGDDKTVHISFLRADGSVVTDEAALQAARVVTESVRLAARLVDTTPEELTTTAYAAEVRALVTEYGGDTVTLTEMVGEELQARGYGGLYGVGKAATCPPRLLIVEYTPPDADATTESVALVGKGIVYDTGGLSLKSKSGMCGMKSDMGGSAALLGAFVSAVRLRVPKKITLILCLAENAIGPTAFRNDDILTMYSGKTVEVNNCDAEGRLVLGDGVAHATQHIAGLDLVIDMATLTGAQMVATGMKHASILANTAALEERAFQAGLRSGDLCFPILYAPELLQSEFDSKVADMKNSVKDRGNAQASCAGHFIEQHLAKDYEGGWLHVDMAGPSCQAERGTGYGVGLILSLLEAPGF
jgi:probable aminopeptidase NPEPL1